MSGSQFLLGAWALTHREILRFYRQRSRIIASLATPLVLWLLIGFGLQAAFPQTAGQKQNFLEHFFPANLVLTILFTSIFSNISTIQDRNEGFLQGVLIAPLSRYAIVCGKVLGGTFIACFQAVLFLLVAPVVGISLTIEGTILIIFSSLLTSFMLSALGFALAWKFDSVQGFHGIMNLLLMPMWLLSGAFFPLESAPLPLKTVMLINPLTWGVKAVRYGLGPVLFDLPHFIQCLSIVLVYALLFLVISALIVQRRTFRETT